MLYMVQLFGEILLKRVDSAILTQAYVPLPLSTSGVDNCFGSGATLWKRRLAEGCTF
jgi:hypothetical protein